MAADPFRREYRADPGTFVGTAFLMGVFFTVVTVIVVRAENHPAIKVLVPGLLIGIAALRLGTEMRTRTCVSRDRILKRGLWRTTATPWQAIQGIETRRGFRNSHVVIRDCQGREIWLPHLGSSEVDVDKEARVLREIWEKRRGSRWEPIPDVTTSLPRGG
ncbi:PH domain-containing protein [Actinomadura sp. 21ATH]|uniref:PH domain-containing protein n=1 Tax=Actinomadura sp. 21ATH TaxID=1735444 RepID=UPI0035C0ACCA